MYAQDNILCQFGLIICHSPTYSFLNQFSSIFGGNCITPSFLDDVISAEIPPITSPVQELVITQMMHGPCGNLNPNSPCMIDGKCDKDFPKDFSNETIVEDIYGYPKYHHQSPQDGGGQFMKTRPNQTNWCEMDNRNVIPYNAFLLNTFNCHINVEYCSSIKSIQYLFKYQYKGNDLATMEIIQDQQNHDEVQCFLNTRYVSSMEATWRILNFDICAVKQNVLQLTLHLPEEQTVTFFHGMDSAMSALLKNEHTQLMKYFEMNLLNCTAQDTFYPDFPEKFTWNPSKKEVDCRTRSIQTRQTKTNWTNHQYTPKQQQTFLLTTTTFALKGIHQF